MARRKSRRSRGLRGMEALAYGGQKTFTPKARKIKTIYCVYKGDKKISCHAKKSVANKTASRKVRSTAKTCSRMFKRVFKVKKHSA